MKNLHKLLFMCLLAVVFAASHRQIAATARPDGLLAAGGSSVTGLVIDQETQRPIGGIRVAISHSRNRTTVTEGWTMAGPDGRFRFNGLVPNDTYYVSPLSEVYVEVRANGTPFTAPSAGCLDMGSIPMNAQGTVTGTVTKRGAPISRELSVGLFFVDRPKIAATYQAVRNGRYKFNIKKGRFYVGLFVDRTPPNYGGGWRWHPSVEQNNVWYYPGTYDLSAARAVDIASGRPVTANFQIP